MQVLQITSLADYAERPRQDTGEVNTLFRDLLIGVTNFFRDAKAFEALQELVMPRLFQGKGPADTIRVWVPGCATGEEVYSLAIMLREHSEQTRSRVKTQIFATDIDEAALAVARAGRYPDTLLQGVSKERLERFFTSEGTSYVVNKAIRDMCVPWWTSNSGGVPSRLSEMSDIVNALESWEAKPERPAAVARGGFCAEFLYQ
jgi:two-component system CheB/CheR fusion protein